MEKSNSESFRADNIFTGQKVKKIKVLYKSDILDILAPDPKFRVHRPPKDAFYDRNNKNHKKKKLKKSKIGFNITSLVSEEHIKKVIQSAKTRKSCINEKRDNIDADFIQPQHLKFPEPSNTGLWKMRKSQEVFTAGYNPKRGDFKIEYNDNAEEILGIAGILNHLTLTYNEEAECDVEEKNLLEELQITLVESYNSRLQERSIKKSVIMEHGLMNSTGTKSWYSKLELSHGKQTAKKLVKFCRVLKADEAEFLFGSLETVSETRANINKLIHCRCQHGLTSIQGITVFEDERKKRELLNERVDVRNITEPRTVKRKQTYHKIFHLPRYKDLLAAEAELCSTLNLIPEFFLDTKGSLVADCKKQNGMLLKRARQLVKIDVNKTRKIFDLLMEQGVIWSPVEGTTTKPRGRQKRKPKKKGNSSAA